MRFRTGSPPHVAPVATTGDLMRAVLLALVPGLAVQVWQFGPGVLIQTLIALPTAAAAEALVLKLRGRAVRPVLDDFSAVLTGVLLAVSLPPLLPWQLTVFGTCFAIVVGKQLYGGLGYNPFNPAMIGYAVLLVSFPRPMTQWLPPVEVAAVHLGLAETFSAVFHGGVPSGVPIDAITGATPLDRVRTALRQAQGLNQMRSDALFGAAAVTSWGAANLAFLAGGFWLWSRRLIARQIPVAFLGVLFAGSLLLFLLDPARYPHPLFHLLSGGTMLGAFFIATDPVTAATTGKGRWIYGLLAGLLVFVIRNFGGYPDGTAFAVLLVNFAAPSIDHWCRPAVSGRSR